MGFFSARVGICRSNRDTFATTKSSWRLEVIRSLGVLVGLFVFGVTVGTPSANAAPIPTATLQTEAETLLNSASNLLVSFTNTGDAIGYYPMLEVKLPAGVTCNSTCQNAIAITSLGGAPVSLTANGPAGAATSYTNPVTGNAVSAAVGESVLFFKLPVGSFAANEPAITYSIPVKLSATADLGVGLPVNATAVFALGTAANGVRGPCGTNDTICTAATLANITPAVLTLEKKVEALVDGATSTGPSYPRRFTIDVTVAESKTTTSVVVSDTIPNTFVLTTIPGSDCKSDPGSIAFVPALGAGDTCSFTGGASGGGTLSVTYGSVTGNPGIDREISYTGYVQELAGGAGAAVVPPTTGATTTSNNSAGATYDYNPGGGNVAHTAGPVSVTLEQRSLYTTKSITNTTTGGSTAKPGDTLTHTLIYDISDYFSFDDLQITDTIGDGQTYQSGTLQVTVYEGSASGVVRNQTQLQAAAGAPLAAITRDPTLGTWSVVLNLSQALTAAAPNGYGAADGALTGADDLGSGTPTRVVLTYQTVVDESFNGPVASGQTQIIDAGDVISDTMTADFQIAGGANRVTINGPTASITITPVNNQQKTIAFKGGSPIASYPISVSPADTLTFRISFDIPTGDVEKLVLKDYLPSPIFDVTNPTASSPSAFIFDVTKSNSAPAAGHIHPTLLSDDVSLDVDVDGNKNALVLSFTRESAATSDLAHIELLVTVAATSNPVANDLLLVNAVYIVHQSSQSVSEINQISAVASLMTAAPQLVVRKYANSVVSGTASIVGSGTSANFASAVAGSSLKFSVDIENTGDYDAYDVDLIDSLPTGFTRVASAPVFVSCGAGPTDTSSGSTVSADSINIPHGVTCTVTYDVVVNANAPFGATITNKATVTYASAPSGPRFAPESDTATTTLASPTLVKSFVTGTSTDSATTDKALRPGESAEFSVAITVPPGTAEAFIVRELESAGAGLTSNFFENFTTGTVIFPSVENNAACGGLFNFVGNTNVCFTNDPNVTQTQATSTIHRVDLGTLNNNAATLQTFTFRYRATVRSGVTAGAYTNRADVEWLTRNSSPSGQVTAQKNSLTATENFTVAKPKLVLAKSSTSTPPLRYGGSAEYTVTLTNTGTSTAYDVADIIDVLPAGLGTASLVSAKLNSSSVAGAPGFSLSQSGQQVTITVRNAGGQARLAAGDVYEVRYSVPLTSSINGSIASLMNKASVANYSTGAADGGPRETLTDVAPASVTLAVDSNVISGRVIFSKETASAGQQNGVSGTTVVLVGTAFTATTDSEGVFLMQGVPDGTYTVRATSSFGDVLSEQTITVTNSDSRNVVFQARPRVTLTKTASTAGPVYPGQEITYTLTLQNVGNYPAFQVSDVVDTLAKGLGNATLTSATYNSTSVTGVAGFAFTQSGQVVTARVRNSSNQPRLNVGDIYLVSYTVPVNSALKAASLTIPNSAELASYATAPTSGYTTESYFDIRCGEVRLETSADHPDCKVSDLNPTIDLMKARIARMRQGVSKAIALRKEFVKAGYCKAADNGCYKCSGTRKKCLNTCRPPSASEDAALVSRALQLKDGANNTIASDLFTQTWTLICSSYSECSLADVASAKDSIEAAGDTMATDMQAVLDSCCMRTARARQALRQRRASLKLAAKLDAKRLSTLMEVYPNPGLVCPAG